MGVLNSFQKITRVLPGYIFGDGRDGALTISSDTTQALTVKGCSGTSGTTSLSLSSAGFSDGDVVIIHQSRGTGAGQWEVNKVASGGGSANLTTSSSLQYTYTDSGASQAQVFKLPMYTNVTVDASKTWSVTDWNQNIGGILSFAANGTLTVTGTTEANGGAGQFSTSTGSGYGTGGGYYGGYVRTSPSGSAQQGEGTPGAGTELGLANGNGGGGAADGTGIRGGAGGGHGTEGEDVIVQILGGDTAGTAGLTTAVFGGGGGGAKNDTGSGAGGGGEIGRAHV